MPTQLHEHEILVYYDRTCTKSRKVVAYASSICSKVNELDLQHNKLTTTIWEQLLAMLDKSPKELLDKSLPYYQENIRGREFAQEDWLKILNQHPGLLKGPIVVKGHKAMQVSNATDIYKI